MRCTGAPHTGHGWPKRPCTAISGRNAVTFAGNAPPASSRSRAVHSPEHVARRRRTAASTSSSSSLLRQRERRQLRAMQDLVGVRVADAAEQMRIGQRALERVILAAQARRERRRGSRSSRRGRRDRTRRARARPCTTCSDARLRVPASVSASVPLSNSRSASVILAGALPPLRQPLQPPGDHEVDDEEVVVVEAEHDALAEARDRRAPCLPEQRIERRHRRAQDERTLQRRRCAAGCRRRARSSASR